MLTKNFNFNFNHFQEIFVQLEKLYPAIQHLISILAEVQNSLNRFIATCESKPITESKLNETPKTAADAFVFNIKDAAARASGALVEFEEVVLEGVVSAQTKIVSQWQILWDNMGSVLQSFVTSASNFWTQFWQSLVLQDWDSLLVGFFNMLATMAAQLGNFLLLTGTGLAFIPGFQMSAGAAAAGLGLLGLAGVLKGLATVSGAHTGGTAFGAPGSSSGGWAGTPPAPEHKETGKTVVINIDSRYNLDTAETIARKVKEALEYANSMGY